MSDDKNRGSFLHPEDGETYDYPTEDESPHHVGHDGKVVRSPAQKAALAAAEERLARLAETADPGPLPAFHFHKSVVELVADESPEEGADEGT